MLLYEYIINTNRVHKPVERIHIDMRYKLQVITRINIVYCNIKTHALLAFTYYACQKRVVVILMSKAKKYVPSRLYNL